MKVRQSNLLRPSVATDRENFFLRHAWERQVELRVVRTWLLDKLDGNLGLALAVAAMFPPRETLLVFQGFAMGRVIETCATFARDRWIPIKGATKE